MWRVVILLLLLIAAPVGSQTVIPSAPSALGIDVEMAFPVTTVLDNFNRADENPLSDGGNWTTGIFSGETAMKVVSNQAAPVDFSGSYRNNANYGAKVEVFVDIPTVSSSVDDYVYLGARLAGTLGGAVDGYVLVVTIAAGADTWEIRRVDDGTQTLLGTSFTQNLSNGDAIGLSIVGSTLTAWYKASGGSWTSLTTRTDSTYSAAGKIGFGAGAGSWRFDNFGGGTIEDRRASVSFAEVEVPNSPRRALISWTELEVPTAPRKGQVSWVEFEVPVVNQKAQISLALLDLPDPPRRALVSFAVFELADEQIQERHRSPGYPTWRRIRRFWEED